MKIAMIVPSLEWEACGIKDYSLMLSEALDGLDVDVQLVASSPQPDIFLWLAAIERIQPDVVHFQHEYGFLPRELGYRFVHEASKVAPLVATMHSVHPDSSRYFARTLFRADGIIVHSQAMAEVLAHQYWMAKYFMPSRRLLPTSEELPPPITLMHMGIDANAQLSDDASFHSARSGHRVALFGLAYPHKGALNALRLLAEIAEDHPEMGVFATFAPPSNADAGVIEAAINLLKLHYPVIDKQFDVRFEHVPYKTLTRNLSEADVILYPYERTEHLAASAAFYTGLAAGVPGIVSDTCFFDHVPEDTAVILNLPWEASSLSDALERVWTAKERGRLRSGVASARDSFNWSRIAEEHLCLYNRLRRSEDGSEHRQ